MGSISVAIDRKIDRHSNAIDRRRRSTVRQCGHFPHQASILLDTTFDTTHDADLDAIFVRHKNGKASTHDPIGSISLVDDRLGRVHRDVICGPFEPNFETSVLSRQGSDGSDLGRVGKRTKDAVF